MEVWLIRHGMTEGNLLRRYTGRTDEPLCAEGVRQLRALAPAPHTGRVFVSPMRRARETASLLFPDARQVLLAGLREMDFGAFEGRSAEQMRDDPAYRAWVDGGCEAACPGGESMAAFAGRVLGAFYTAASLCIARGYERLVIVAHGGTVRSILAAYGRPARSFYEWDAPNGGGWQARLDPAQFLMQPLLTGCAPLVFAPRGAQGETI